MGASLVRTARAAGLSATGIGRRACDGVRATGYTPQEIAALIDASGADFIAHAAGPASVAASMDDTAADFAGSVELFLQVLEGVRLSSRRPRVVYLSSAAVYGNPERLPVTEDAPRVPVSAYGYHKLVCEMLAENYAVCFGVPGLVVRLFSVFGEDQRRLLVWELFRQYREVAELVLAGTGEEERDYLHVDDLAALVWRCAQSALEPFVSLNIAGGVSIRVADLAQHIGDALGQRKPVVCHGQRNPGDPAIWRADVTRMRELAGPDCSPGFDARLRQVLAAWSR